MARMMNGNRPTLTDDALNALREANNALVLVLTLAPKDHRENHPDPYTGAAVLACPFCAARRATAKARPVLHEAG